MSTLHVVCHQCRKAAPVKQDDRSFEELLEFMSIHESECRGEIVIFKEEDDHEYN